MDVNGVDSVTSLHDLVMWSESWLIQHDVYYGHGTENALDEAAYLVSYILKLPPDYQGVDLSQPVSDENKQAVLALLKRRIDERLPAPYLTHEAWFAGHKFYVDERVLVPRSPVAELINEQFAPWLEQGRIHQVLDLCTGSACIAIATALALPQVHVDAADISAQALDVAAKNVASYDLADRLSLYESDLFSGLAGKKYDLIISNPPYVDAEDMQALPQEYHHEPQLGLSAGKDGLDLVIPMLRDTAEFLNPQGVMIVEVGNSAEALAEQFPQVPFTWLEFEFGGHGVFLLEARDVSAYHEVFEKAAEQRNSRLNQPE